LLVNAILETFGSLFNPSAGEIVSSDAGGSFAREVQQMVAKIKTQIK